MRKRVLLAFGTRPEAIKMAPLYLALKADAARFETLCCVTAQHREMLDDVLRVFGITPDFDLDLMQPGQGLAELHAGVLLGMRDVMREARPDIVLVHGDTTTTFASAQAGFYAGIPVGHVEAGLRSGDLAAPFPEEMNRRATDMMARYHFAPTEGNREHLLGEGHDPEGILVTGNTVVDALRLIAELSAESPEVGTALKGFFPFDWREQPFAIVTCHRRECHGRAIVDVVTAVRGVAKAFPEMRFVFVSHPNPAVAGPVRDLLEGSDAILIVDPLPYDVFVPLLMQCRFLLTDSGGLQEEGIALGKPVLVMRETTERPEGIASGGAKLIGTSHNAIFAAVSDLLEAPDRMEEMAAAPNPYGDGMAADRIVDFLARR